MKGKAYLPLLGNTTVNRRVGALHINRGAATRSALHQENISVTAYIGWPYATRRKKARQVIYRGLT